MESIEYCAFDKEALQNYIYDMILEFPDGEDLIERSKDERLVYPFNSDFHYLLVALVGRSVISFEEYEELVLAYSCDNENLRYYEDSPRLFGEGKAEKIVEKNVEALVKPTKDLDVFYKGQYDLLYPGSRHLNEKIRVEVKASRAVDSKSKEPLYRKAISSKSDKTFLMNFGQIKPKDCDVFVIVGVWADKKRYWVLSSEEVENYEHYCSGQHRYNKGKEGQFSFTQKTIQNFRGFECKEHELESYIIDAYKRQKIASFT